MNYDALSPIVKFNNVSGNPCEKRTFGDDLVALYRSLIVEEYNETMDAFDDLDVKGVVDGAGDLIVVAAGLLHALGFDPNRVMVEINKSNMSKFCYNEHDASLSVQAYANDVRYKDLHWKIVDGVYVILGKKKNDPSNGWKILKGIHYHEPDLDSLLEERNGEV